MTNVTSLGVFRTHAQKEYDKVLEMKSTYNLNILTLLCFYSESRESPIQIIMRVSSKSLNYLPIFFSNSMVDRKVDS